MHSQGTGPLKLLLWLVVAALLLSGAACSAYNQDPWQVVVHPYRAQLIAAQHSNNYAAAGPHAQPGLSATVLGLCMAASPPRLHRCLDRLGYHSCTVVCCRCWVCGAQPPRVRLPEHSEGMSMAREEQPVSSNTETAASEQPRPQMPPK
jgi:hypothetical protein